MPSSYVNSYESICRYSSFFETSFVSARKQYAVVAVQAEHVFVPPPAAAPPLVRQSPCSQHSHILARKAYIAFYTPLPSQHYIAYIMAPKLQNHWFVRQLSWAFPVSFWGFFRCRVAFGVWFRSIKDEVTEVSEKFEVSHRKFRRFANIQMLIRHLRMSHMMIWSTVL
jgi:hypothetical protein